MFFTKGEIIMNSIYKVIWSKAKNCYVVASEIAKSHTKSASGQSVRRSALASLLALSLLCGGLGVASASLEVVDQSGTAGTVTIYTKDEVDHALTAKGAATDVAKNTADIATNKANITKLENDKLSKDVASATYATKDALNDLTTTVNGKADKSTVATALDGKANKADTLAGYGITDAYTKGDVDDKLNAKADAANVFTKDQTYTRDQVNTKLADYAKSADVYTKTDADAKFATSGALTTAKTELEGKINAEKTAREAEDNKINTKIGSIDDTRTQYVKESQTISQNLTKLDEELQETNERTAGIEYDKARDETTIGGQVTVNSIGDVTARGQLTAKGGVNAGNSDITTTGDVSAGSLNVTDASHLKGDVTMDNNLTVKGDTTLKGTKVDGKLAVTDDADLQNTKVDGTLITTGEATFQEAVEMDKGLTVTGDTKLKATTVDGKLTAGDADLKNTQVGGTLNVTGDTTLDGALTAKGEAKFEKNVTVGKDLTVDGKLNVGEIYLENNKLESTGKKHDSATSITADGISNLAKVTELGHTTESQFTHNEKGTFNYAKDGDSTDWTETRSDVTANGVTTEAKDSKGNRTNTSQTASENKTYLEDKDGKNTNSTIDTAKGYDKTIKGENGQTSTKQDELNITNTAEQGTIKNDAMNIENNATGDMTNTVGGKLTTTVTGQATENFNGGLDTNVTGKENHTVTGDQNIHVTGKQTNEIGGDQENTIGGNQTTTVEGNVKEDYKKDLTTTVGGNELHEVTGTKTENVTGMVTENYKAGQETNVTGNQDIYVSENQTNTIDGDQVNTIGGDQTTTVEGNVKEDYKKDLTTTVGGNELHEVTGTKTENVTGKVTENYGNGQETNVTGDQYIHVTGKQTNKIDGDQVNTIGGNQTTTVTGDISNKAENITNEANTKLTDKVGDNTRVLDGEGITDTVGGSNLKSIVTQKKGSIETVVTDGTSFNHSRDIPVASTKTLTGYGKMNQLLDDLNSSTKTITDGTHKTSKVQTALDITNTAADGTITNDAKDIVNNATGNMTNTVGGDLTTTVGGNELHEVTGKQTNTVGGGQINNITGGQINNITGDQTTTVTGNQDIHVTENQTNTIDGNQENTIGGDQTTNVTGDISNTAKNITNAATETLTDKVGENTRVITSRSITDTVGRANRMIEDGKITDNAGDFTVTTDKENGTTFTNAGSTASSFTTVDGTNTGSAQRWTNVKGNEISTGKVEANYVKMDYADVMNDLGVKGTTTTKTLKVTENATVGGTLDVTQKATFHDDVDIKKNLSVDGNATIKGDVTARSYKVDGKTYIDANGINANNQKITNVADGSISEGSKDAVNGGQLYGVKRDLEHQVDKVGANAAAMANLRPMEFDPSSKWNIAAAIGNYGSETAAAIGAFYRPNDNVMVNLSTAFGTGENMVGGGVSVRLGKGGNKLSREETNALKAQVADLTARMDALLSVLNPNMSKDFPDVPENHWAYEAVSRLAGNDIVQGYPDGEFHGERTMTRYEMAEIIYNALSRGAEAERKLVEEFKPELQAMAASEKSTAEKAEG